MPLSHGAAFPSSSVPVTCFKTRPTVAPPPPLRSCRHLFRRRLGRSSFTVREIVAVLDLDVLYYPCPRNGPNFRAKVSQMGGKQQFPYMVDPNTGVVMYESDDIIKYLVGKYGDGNVPLSLSLGLLTTLTKGFALIGRMGKVQFRSSVVLCTLHQSCRLSLLKHIEVCLLVLLMMTKQMRQSFDNVFSGELPQLKFGLFILRRNFARAPPTKKNPKIRSAGSVQTHGCVVLLFCN